MRSSSSITVVDIQDMLLRSISLMVGSAIWRLGTSAYGCDVLLMCVVCGEDMLGDVLFDVDCDAVPVRFG